MAPALPSWAVLGFLVLTLANLGEGGKLLVVPQDGSQWLSMSSLVEELHQRGHEIVLVVQEVNVMIETSRNFTVKTYSVPYTIEQLESQIKSLGQNSFGAKSNLNEVVALYRQISNWMDLMLSGCQYFLADRKLLQYLQESQFDALLIDPFVPCGLIVAEYLSIPSIMFMKVILCDLNQKAAQCPHPLSYVPRLLTGYSDHMVFFQRLNNLLHAFSDMWLCHVVYSGYERLASQFLKKEVTALELYGQASIWLLRYDFYFEFPHPVVGEEIISGR